MEVWLKGGEIIKDAVFVGARSIQRRIKGKTIDASKERDELLKIAPEEANVYVWFKTYVEFYKVNPQVIEAHFNYISGNW